MKKLLILPFLIVCINSMAQNIDSLWDVWNDTTQIDTARLKAINDIILEAYLYNKPDSALCFSQIEYEFAKSTNNIKWEASAFDIQGNIFKIKGNYYKSIECYNNSLEIYEKITDKQAVIKTLNNIGIIYYKQSNYGKAIHYYNRSLKISEEINHNAGVANSLNVIGVIYHDQNDYERAIDYYEKSFTIYKKIDDKQGIALSFNNIGIIYSKQNNYNKAIEYFKKSLEIKEENDRKQGIANTLNNIGNIYFEQGDYTEALKYYNKALIIDNEFNNKIGVAISLTNIGNIYAVQRNYNKAIFNYNKALDIAQEMNVIFETKEIAKALYETYKTVNNYRKSFEMYELYIKMRDSIQSEENQREVIRQEYKYAYEKQAVADSIKIAEAKKVTDAQIIAQQSQLKQEKTQRYALLGGSLALLIIAFIVIRFQFIKRQQEKQLYQANNLLEKEKLKVYEKELEYNKQRLSVFINNIAKKNTIIQKLEIELEENYSKEAMKVNQLKELTEMKILTNEDWAEFKSLFLKVYPNFLLLAKEQFPDLSASELRHFMLMKLKHSTSEIANISGISVSGVKKSRYRLRKKLKLNENDNLQSFVSGFSKNN